jgi:hypothetical protein
MTIAHKHNATGRTTGKLKGHRRSKFSGQFIMVPVDMLRSPAWALLNLTDRRILDRMELEHADHGGADNGALPVRYADFKAFGIRQQSIALSLRRLMALGFIVRTAQGRRAFADIPGSAAQYRITYIDARGIGRTNDWQKISSLDEAIDRLRSSESDYQQQLDDNPRSARNLSREAYGKRLIAPTGENKTHRCNIEPDTGANMHLKRA